MEQQIISGRGFVAGGRDPTEQIRAIKARPRFFHHFFLICPCIFFYADLFFFCSMMGDFFGLIACFGTLNPNIWTDGES